MFTIYLKQFVRTIGLLPLVEKFRALISPLKYFFRNKRFVKNHPDFSLPPKELTYDAFGGLDFHHYLDSGIEIAKILKSEYQKVTPILPHRMLEWGCGPGRIIRQLPSTFGEQCKVYGTDYNAKTVEWCAKTFPDINFLVNDLAPPLNFEDDFFDYIYASSVFTHLSKEMNFKWLAEIHRILKPNGVFLFSTMGEMVRSRLTKSELTAFNQTGFLSRAKFQEGKKNFAAYHHPDFIKNKMLKNWELKKFVPQGWPVRQDLWVVQKPLNV